MTCIVKFQILEIKINFEKWWGRGIGRGFCTVKAKKDINNNNPSMMTFQNTCILTKRETFHPHNKNARHWRHWLHNNMSLGLWASYYSNFVQVFPKTNRYRGSAKHVHDTVESDTTMMLPTHQVAGCKACRAYYYAYKVTAILQIIVRSNRKPLSAAQRRHNCWHHRARKHILRNCQKLVTLIRYD